MKRPNREEKLAKKRSTLVERTAAALAISNSEAESLLRIPRQQSLRINTLKGAVSGTLEELESLRWRAENFEWLAEGFYSADDLTVVRDSHLVDDGKVYIQNAASWLPVLALDPQPGDSILDVCAAPGGKTTHLAARAQNNARITANDNSRIRLAKLRATCARLDAHAEKLTLYDAQNIARKLKSYQFDKILLDAPCSGEGLMNLDRDKDFQMWSTAQIKRLQQLQKRILAQSWQLLKPGGTLVYSTCTMAPEENEAVIDYALRALPGCEIDAINLPLPNRVVPVEKWNGKSFDKRTQDVLRLKPSQYIEAFFVCKLIKNSAANSGFPE